MSRANQREAKARRREDRAVKVAAAAEPVDHDHLDQADVLAEVLGRIERVEMVSCSDAHELPFVG